MIRKLLWVMLPIGCVAMVWYGVTGDAGPMGWLNALRQHWTGHRSRKLSLMLFCFGTIALSSPMGLDRTALLSQRMRSVPNPVNDRRRTFLLSRVVRNLQGGLRSPSAKIGQ